MGPRWHGATIHGPITEVKQLWAWLVLGLVTIWDTLVAAKDVIDTCCVLLLAYVIWPYKRFPECSPTHKKTRMCAVMSMWLCMQKNMCGLTEHAQPPYFYLVWVSAALKGQTIKRYCLISDGRPICSQGVDLGGGGYPSRKVEWHSMESDLCRK